MCFDINKIDKQRKRKQQRTIQGFMQFIDNMLAMSTGKWRTIYYLRGSLEKYRYRDAMELESLYMSTPCLVIRSVR